MKQFLVLFVLFAATAMAYHHEAAPHGYEVRVHHHHAPLHHSAPIAGAHYGHGHGHGEDYYHHPSYKFEYGVHDPHTHDHKSQWEMRDGDVVKGEYTLDEADGTKRIVKYHADGKTGFHAHVERVGHAAHHHGHHY